MLVHAAVHMLAHMVQKGIKWVDPRSFFRQKMNFTKYATALTLFATAATAAAVEGKGTDAAAYPSSSTSSVPAAAEVLPSKEVLKFAMESCKSKATFKKYVECMKENGVGQKHIAAAAFAKNEVELNDEVLTNLIATAPITLKKNKLKRCKTFSILDTSASNSADLSCHSVDPDKKPLSNEQKMILNMQIIDMAGENDEYIDNLTEHLRDRIFEFRQKLEGNVF